MGVTREVTGILPFSSLDELARELGSSFFRAHRKFLVNVDMITEVIPYFGGSYRLKLRGGVEIPLSRRPAGELRRMLGF